MPASATYTGTFIHTPSLGKLEVLENKKVFVDERGVITAIEDLRDEQVVEEREKGRLRWWFPGFVGKGGDQLLFDLPILPLLLALPYQIFGSKKNSVEGSSLCVQITYTNFF